MGTVIRSWVFFFLHEMKSSESFNQESGLTSFTFLIVLSGASILRRQEWKQRDQLGSNSKFPRETMVAWTREVARG